MNINVMRIFFAGVALIAFFVVAELTMVLLISGNRYTFDKKLKVIKICFKRTIYNSIIVTCRCFRTICFHFIIGLVGIQIFILANGGMNKLLVILSWITLLVIYVITEHHTEHDMKRIAFLNEKKCGMKLAINNGFGETELNVKLSDVEQNIQSYEKAFLGLKFPKE